MKRGRVVVRAESRNEHDSEALPQTHGESRVVESILKFDSLSQISGIDWTTEPTDGKADVSIVEPSLPQAPALQGAITEHRILETGESVHTREAE